MESKPSLDLLYELYSAFAPRASDTTSTPGSGYRSLTFSSVAPNSNTEKAAAKPIATAGVSITASFPKPLKLAPLVTEKNGKPQSLLFGGSTQHDRFVQEGAVRQVTFPTKTVRDGASVELIPVMNHPVIKTLVEELTKHEISSVSDIVVLYGQKLRADDQGMSRNPTAFLVSAFNLPNREFRLLSLDVKKSTTSWYPSGEKYIDMHIDEEKTLHAATIYQRRLHSLKLDNHLVPQEESLLSYGIHLKHFTQGSVEVCGGQVQYAGSYAYSIENDLISNDWNVFMVKKGDQKLTLLNQYQFGQKITALKIVDHKLLVLDEMGILSVVPLNKDGSVEPPNKNAQVFLTQKAKQEFEVYYGKAENMAMMRSTPNGFNRLEATDKLIIIAMKMKLVVISMHDFEPLQTFECEKIFNPEGDDRMVDPSGAITGLKVLSLPGKKQTLLAVFFQRKWMFLFNVNSPGMSGNYQPAPEGEIDPQGAIPPLQYLGRQQFHQSETLGAKVVRIQEMDLILVHCRGEYDGDDEFEGQSDIWDCAQRRLPVWFFNVKINT